MGYQDVKDRLYRGHRKIANNTRLVLARDVPKHTECIVMTLHGNVVARFYPTHIQLFSAGWHTTTTKNRLNLALDLAKTKYVANVEYPYRRRIYQVDYQWYYGSYHKGDPKFSDGMYIDYIGKVIGG